MAANQSQTPEVKEDAESGTKAETVCETESESKGETTQNELFTKELQDDSNQGERDEQCNDLESRFGL